MADKSSVKTNLCGDVVFPFENANVRLSRALYTPKLGYNLVSAGRLADYGIESLFCREDFQLNLEADGFIVGHGKRSTDESCLYTQPEPEMQENYSTEDQAMVTSYGSQSSSSAKTELWHRRLAHLNIRDLAGVHKYVNGFPDLKDTKDVCRACRLGKAHKLPFSGQFCHADAVGDLVHSDTIGPVAKSFPDGFRYACTFLDDHSRYPMVGYMTRRSSFSNLFDPVSRKFLDLGGAEISKLHSDGAK